MFDKSDMKANVEDLDVGDNSTDVEFDDEVKRREACLVTLVGEIALCLIPTSLADIDAPDSSTEKTSGLRLHKAWSRALA